MATLTTSPAIGAGGTITGNVAQTGATTLSTGTGAVSLNGDTTIASAKTLAITTADKLTEGGIIVPTSLYISIPLFVTDLSKAIFVAPEALQVVYIRESHSVASISGTVTVEKLTGTTAAGSGTDLLTGTLSLAGTADTVLSGTLTSTTADLQLAAGNRLSVKLAGTLTSLVGAVVTIGFKRI